MEAEEFLFIGSNVYEHFFRVSRRQKQLRFFVFTKRFNLQF